MKIENLAAVVTGGASGLGRATAKQLADAGAKVAVFDFNADLVMQTAQDIGGLFVKVDVSDDASAQAGLLAAEGQHGVARILVNCAGVSQIMKVVGKGFIPHTMDAYRRTIEVNLIGTLNMIAKFAARAAATEEIDGERGVIVNTASVAAFDGQVGQVAYAASKGGIVGMTLPAARDLAQHKIRVVSIAPGIFLTPMVEGLPQSVQDSLGAQVPHPSRLGKPSEFAELVACIIRNPMLNGEVIRLDGAIRMAPR